MRDSSRRCRPRTHHIVIATALACTAATGSAWAQTRNGAPRKPSKWTIELLAGGSFGPPPSGGSAGSLPAGTPFTTAGGFPSRFVPSWYFGDGSALFNEVQAQFESRFAIQFPRITPLDSVVTSAAIERPPAATFGVRLTRQLTPRLSLEFGVQRTQGKLQLSSEAVDGIETARASFDSAMRGLLGTVPLTDLVVTSEADVPGDTSSTQTTVTGVLNVGLTNSGRLKTHVSIGGGYVSNAGDAMEVRLDGNYQFRAFDLSRHNESDRVVAHFDGGDSSLIGVAGAGFTYDIGARQGLRADFRVHAGSSHATTSLEAAADVRKSIPATSLSAFTTPSIQFSNLSGINSSLNGRLLRQDTFTGSGLETRMHVTVGYYFRF